MAADPKLMPLFVRLQFHDAVGPGGADGAPLPCRRLQPATAAALPSL
jgi:hypothetical protein